MKCPTCGVKIGLMSMMSHRKTHKEGSTAKAGSFKCGCGTSFGSKSELEAHAKKAHKM